ncbi:MAG TPA: beta-1,4-N-acetylgalactosaminyltransferase [Armatimonadetes bacterium]|nr:beta-1,4-N-acetylgalactosaminyltransferase [Armatimonadota bacterium]
MKVYDCFTFFNELELLELRLKLLNDVVDYFVLVESNKTFKNKDKEFVFEANKSMFEEYLAKIIYIRVEDMPDYDPAVDNIWTLEIHQRNSIMRGLENSSPEDLIFISDIDEIPNSEVVRLLDKSKCEIKFLTYGPRRSFCQAFARFPLLLFKHHGMKLLDRMPLVLEQSLFYYFVNCRSKGKWPGTIITRFKNLTTPQKLRNRRYSHPRIINGGWHFSYLGGAERVAEKVNSIIGVPGTAYPKDYLEECIANGLDIYGRDGQEFEYEFINIVNAGFPEHMNAIIEKYPYLYFDKI